VLREESNEVTLLSTPAVMEIRHARRPKWLPFTATGCRSIDNGVSEVLATAGDTYLGGEDLDNRVMNSSIMEYKKDRCLEEPPVNKVLASKSKALRMTTTFPKPFAAPNSIRIFSGKR
jgi:hypothetical protein